MTEPSEQDLTPEAAAEQAVTVDVPHDLEALLVGAVDEARAAIVEFSGEDTVGEYLGSGFEDPTSATHRFLAELPGYRGWQWAVVVAGCPGAAQVTISEVVLVPGPTALLAPKWVPWEERIRPGDLSPGDLLAPPADDPRLTPGYTATGDPQVDEVALEVGLGRRQVLSLWGRNDTAQRWHDGDHGPGSAMARATRRTCRDCGFYLPLGGALGVMFGVCANEFASDGHVVDAEYGCGAHSDTPAPPGTGSPMYDPYDDGVVEVVEVGAPTEADAAAEAGAPAEAAAPVFDVAPAEVGAPVDDAAPVEVGAPVDDAAPVEGSAPAEGSALAEAAAPVVDVAPAEVGAPVDDAAPAEGGAPAEGSAPAEGGAPAEGSATADALPPAGDGAPAEDAGES